MIAGGRQPARFLVGILIGPQHGVHAGLIPLALFAKPVQHVLIDAQGHALLTGREHETRLRPVDVERSGVGVFGYGFGDVFVGHRIEPGIIRTIRHLSRLFSRHAHDTFWFLGHLLSLR